MAYLRWRRIRELAALDRPGLAARIGGGKRNGAAPVERWDGIYRAGQYDGLLAWDRRHQHRLMAGLIAERFEHPRVLEIGCGDGALYESLRLFRPARHLGVDISPEAIARLTARRGAELAPGAVEFVVGDGGRFEPGETFDAILFSDCIEYLGDIEALLAHYARFLAPGGVFGAVQWLSLAPIGLWDEVKARTEILDEALVQAPWGGAWQVWTARPKG